MIVLPPVQKDPCPLCGKRLGGLDMLAHLGWHARTEQRV